MTYTHLINNCGQLFITVKCEVMQRIMGWYLGGILQNKLSYCSQYNRQLFSPSTVGNVKKLYILKECRVNILYNYKSR